MGLPGIFPNISYVLMKRLKNVCIQLCRNWAWIPCTFAASGLLTTTCCEPKQLKTAHFRYNEILQHFPKFLTDTVFLGQSRIYQSQVVFSTQSHICNLCDCFVQRNAADARQDWRRNTTNGHCLLLNRKSFPTENLRSGWGDTRQVFQVGFVGPQREDAGGWWEGGCCRLGGVMQCNP